MLQSRCDSHNPKIRTFVLCLYYKPGEFKVFDGYLVADKKPVAGVVDYSKDGLSKDEIQDLETEINANLVDVYVQVVEEHSSISRFFYGRDVRYIRYKLDK